MDGGDWEFRVLLSLAFGFGFGLLACLLFHCPYGSMCPYSIYLGLKVPI